MTEAQKTPQNTLHIYTRVSTKSQMEDGVSLESQLEEGIKKQKSLGLEYYQLWNEESASSDKETLENRPIMRELLESVDDGQIKHLYALDNSRLSRNETTQFTLSVAFRKHGVKLHTNALTTDFTNEQDMFLRRILDAVSTYENTMRVIRSRLGKIRRIREGFWYGAPPPYGYKIENKKLVPDEKERKTVKLIFDEFYKGTPIIKIKGMLDRKGILARRGNPFATGSIHRLMKNTHYVGYFSYHDKVYEETIRGTCESILEKSLWDDVQEKLNTNNKRKATQRNQSTKNFYLLTGLLECSCGLTLSGRIRESKNEFHYYCRNKEKSWKKSERKGSEKWLRGKVGDYGCDMTRSLNIPKTDAFVWDAVIETVSNSILIKEEFKKEIFTEQKTFAKSAKELKSQQRKTEKLRKEISNISQTIGDLRASLVTGAENPEELQTMIAKLQTHRTEKEQQIEQSRIQSAKFSKETRWLDWLKKFNSDLGGKSVKSPQDKKEYLEGLIDKIVVNFDKDTNEHSLDFRFKLALVNDGIEYKNATDKSVGYDIVEGEKSVEKIIPFTDLRGRKKKLDLIPHQYAKTPP